jgi:uncharacterized protein
MRDMLASGAAGQTTVDVLLRFSRDEENRFVVSVRVEADLAVLCQRCLEPVPVSIRSENRLAVVGNDDAARQLPSSLEPWVVEEEAADLWALVEDELILALPLVAYHDTEECTRLMDAYRRLPDPEESSDSPFKVLERLKAATPQEEK